MPLSAAHNCPNGATTTTTVAQNATPGFLREVMTLSSVFGGGLYTPDRRRRTRKLRPRPREFPIHVPLPHSLTRYPIRRRDILTPPLTHPNPGRRHGMHRK